MDYSYRLRLITGFRIFTLLLSFFAFLYQIDSIAIVNNSFIIMTLLLVNIFIISFQSDHLTDAQAILLWCIEIIGVAGILYMTGGIFSLYFWMIFNPMLLINHRRMQMVVTQHIILLLFIIALILFAPLAEQVDYRLHIVLGIFVIFIYSVITSLIYREQYQINHALQLAKGKLEVLNQQNMALTESIYDFTILIEKIAIVEDYTTVRDAFAEFIRLTFGDEGIFLSKSADGTQFSCEGPDLPCWFVQSVVDQLKTGQQKVEVHQLNGFEYYIIHLKYENYHHIIGRCMLKQTGDDQLVDKQLLLLRELYQIAVAKLNMYTFKRELLIKDEQNRIAEEMHDSVNQELFAISCQLFDLKQKLSTQAIDEQQRQSLDAIYDTVKHTNKKLKSIIYRMSREKSTQYQLLDDLKTYVQKVATLYGIDIDFQIEKDVLNGSEPFYNAILRVINESLSNAVKHGRASHVKISLNQDNDFINIEIFDNGQGFDIEQMRSKVRGIGLVNMNKLTKKHNGKFSIKYDQDRLGTCVKASFLRGECVE